MSKKALKALYVVPIAFVEALTVSFYKNVKRRMNGKKEKGYVQIKVPAGYKDDKLEPEYKDLSKNNSSEGNMMNIFQ